MFREFHHLPHSASLTQCTSQAAKYYALDFLAQNTRSWLINMRLRKHNNGECTSAGRVSAHLLLSWLAASSTVAPASASWQDSWFHAPNQLPLVSSPLSRSQLNPPSSQPREHEFRLRQIFHHGTHKHPDLHVRRDLGPDEEVWVHSEDGDELGQLEPLLAASQSEYIERLLDRGVATVQNMYHSARMRGAPPTLDSSAWTLDEVVGPNTTDRKTVVSLAKMSWDAYTEKEGDTDWQGMKGSPFNLSQSFGWEGDSLRGHVFADEGNATIVIALKGTSMAVFDGAETTTNDKENDNLFFGCCCGQGGHYLWRQVCSCMTSTFTCNSTCLVSELRQPNRYYAAALELYGNVTELYPNSNVWMVGHSLGGSLSALVGLTFGVPVVTFEAPGDALPAARLGLPSPPSAHPSAPQTRQFTGARHFGHTADPVFMGTCNAATSGCTLGGYALQTQCHTGKVCAYDTVADKSWRVGVGNHRISTVIHDVLEAYNETATCVSDDECVDCFNWKYFESNGSDTTTTRSSTTTSSTSALPTETCKTPGWWGCLDEKGTTTTTSSPTPTLPATSCLKYGWFGGCLETTTLSPTTTNPAVITTPAGLLTTSCAYRGWFGGCYSTTTIEVFPTTCVAYGWLGGCVATSTLGVASAAATPAAAMVPTITTTRPVPIARKPTPKATG